MPRIPITVLTGAEDAQLQAVRDLAPHAAWVVHDASMLEAPFAASACACCRAGASMTASLLDLFRRRTQGEAPAFDRIIVTAPPGQAGDALIELNRSAAANAACRIAGVSTWAGGEDAWIADHTLGHAGPTDRSIPLDGRAWTETLGPGAALRAGHDQSLEDFVLGWSDPQSLDAVGDWLHGLSETLGARVLRIHGEVHTPHGPFAIEARRHALAPPAPLTRSSTPGSRLRFVTQGLEPGDLSPGWPTGAARCTRAGGTLPPISVTNFEHASL
jgi:hypothetical protein